MPSKINHNEKEDIESASIEELRSLQLQRMKKTLEHA